jgi:hypothetical protein
MAAEHLFEPINFSSAGISFILLLLKKKNVTIKARTINPAHAKKTEL